MKLIITLLTCICSLHSSAIRRDSTALQQPTALAVILTVVNSTCQKANGKILIQATGGVAPYQYENVTRSFPLSGPIDYNLMAGTYTIKVTDAIGQTVTQDATINNLFPKPKATVISKTSPSGCTTFDATLTLQGSIGPAPYTYTLDGYHFQTNNTFTNLTAGNFSYAVKDANGCTSDDISTSLFAEPIRPNCPIFGGAGGSGSCNPLYLIWDLGGIEGGTPPYTYSRDGINYQTSTRFDSVPVGILTIWIKDATGLIGLASVSRIDPHYNCLPFFVTTSTTTAQCGQNGSITAIANEGTPPYQYSLDGGNTYQTSNIFTGLAPKTYTVTVKDDYQLTSAILVAVPDNCVITTAATTNSTCSNSNGTITASASNGIAPYSYSLDGVSYTSNNKFTGLAPANYTVYGKDAAGAVGKASIVISNIAGPQITSVNTIATGCNNHSGSITIAAQNGTAPLTYSIDGNIFQSNPVFANLAQNNYTASIKDANSCVATAPAVVAMSTNQPIVQLGSDTVLCDNNMLLLDATNTNATYLWQDNTTSPTYLVTKTGKYFVTVNRQDCIAKDTITVMYNYKPAFTLNADSRICMGTTITLDPQITGVSYLWQDGSTNRTYSVTQPGYYALTATNSCGAATTGISIGKGICDLYMPNSFTPNGDAKNDLFKAGYGDNVTEFHLQVFNRYGELIFESKDKDTGWDGNYKGQRQPYDTYVWVIQYKTVVNNNLQKLQGTVLLIR